MELQEIFSQLGFKIKTWERVSGGDINSAYCLFGQDQKYFLKINEATSLPGMFAKEAQALRFLNLRSVIKVPQVIQYGELDTDQFLLLEWLETGKAGAHFWSHFGAGLAALHQETEEQFGWPEDNYIGSLVQLNKQAMSWPTFYTECRLLPLAKKLRDGGIFHAGDSTAMEILCKKLPALFPDEKPALLHGDLWSGNYMVQSSGEPGFCDPAIYYGHREMDLGMARLFGGFDAKFYQAYDEVNPLQPGWQQRVELTQLYPLLVHAVLFGGHYINSARAVVNSYR